MPRPPAMAAAGLDDGEAAAADSHRTWKQLYTAAVGATTLSHPHGDGCTSERPYLQRGREFNKKVDCGPAGMVNMARACSLALGQRPRLSNDRTTRVRQAKAPKKTMTAAADASAPAIASRGASAHQEGAAGSGQAARPEGHHEDEEGATGGDGAGRGGCCPWH